MPWGAHPLAGPARRRFRVSAGRSAVFRDRGLFSLYRLRRCRAFGRHGAGIGLLVSLALLAEVFLLRPYLARRTQYVLTDRRAIILRPSLSGLSQQDYPLATMKLVSLTKGVGQGTGSIGFAETAGWSSTRLVRVIGFEHLPDAEAVHAKMLAAKEALEAAPTREVHHG
ncbi:hypothetical protein QWZ10_13065 [Paracoccus cavernae]|uniref:PH domain-containing protein n=1 Tax=Paracoccus cavernae TaxID=1571207 RepID=A0ABT8D962_9RHOB|nr:hypothetical protein [Paracoccus cavernae]